MRYNASLIEQKWQDLWSKDERIYEPLDISLDKPKKYILSMFPYPSGNIHMGHVRNYCIGDAIARYFRREGFNVLHPIGWDAFGLPAENAAIKHKSHPRDWTYSNIEAMREVLERLGLSFSRKREFATSDEDYTKFEQEFFINMWEHDLIYRKKAYLNWCPNDLTVLANEQVIEGKCWRCGTEVVQKEMHQYYARITRYAEELLRDLDDLEGKWPAQVIAMQRNWIGKSIGLDVTLKLDEAIGEYEDISIFTTRADTIYGMTFCALAPEHGIVKALLDEGRIVNKEALLRMQSATSKDRLGKEKEGFNLGIKVIHPLTGNKIDLWVANFVLMEYGSGAVMCVPAHDSRDHEFAVKFNINIVPVIKPIKVDFNASPPPPLIRRCLPPYLLLYPFWTTGY